MSGTNQAKGWYRGQEIAEEAGIHDFRPTYGWYSRFLKRHGLADNVDCTHTRRRGGGGGEEETPLESDGDGMSDEEMDHYEPVCVAGCCSVLQ